MSTATPEPTTNPPAGILHQGSNSNSNGPALKRARIRGYMTPPPPPESSSAFVDVALPPSEQLGGDDHPENANLYQEPAHHQQQSQPLSAVTKETSPLPPPATTTTTTSSAGGGAQRYRHNPYDSRVGRVSVDDLTGVSSYFENSSHNSGRGDSANASELGDYGMGTPTQHHNQQGGTPTNFSPPSYQVVVRHRDANGQRHSSFCRQQHQQTLERLQQFMEDQLPNQQTPGGVFNCACDPYELRSRSSLVSNERFSDGTWSATPSSSQVPGLSDASYATGAQFGYGAAPPAFVSSQQHQHQHRNSHTRSHHGHPQLHPQALRAAPMPNSPQTSSNASSPQSQTKTGVHVGHFYPGQQQHVHSNPQKGPKGAKPAEPKVTSQSASIKPNHQPEKISKDDKLRLLSPARRQVKIAPDSENTSSSPLAPASSNGSPAGPKKEGQFSRRSSGVGTPKPISRSSSAGTKGSSRFNSAHRSVSVGSRHSTANSVSSYKRSAQRSPSVTSRRSCNSRTGSVTSRFSVGSKRSLRSGVSGCSKYSRASASSRRSVQSRTVLALRQLRKRKAKEAKRQAKLLSKLPPGTLHRGLFGKVSFVPYPTAPFIPPRSSMFPSAGAVQFSCGADGCEGQHQAACGSLCKGGFHHHCTKECEDHEAGPNSSGTNGNNGGGESSSANSGTPWVRLFFGQLPYEVTQMQLDWLCFTFGFGRTVHDMERIFKFDAKKSCRVPTGCLHAYCHKEYVDDIITGINRRLLVDDTGVWYARGGIEEQEALQTYCEGMKSNKKMRIHSRPYDAVSVQLATSSRGSGGQIVGNNGNTSTSKSSKGESQQLRSCAPAVPLPPGHHPSGNFYHPGLTNLTAQQPLPGLQQSPAVSVGIPPNSGFVPPGGAGMPTVPPMAPMVGAGPYFHPWQMMQQQNAMFQQHYAGQQQMMMNGGMNPALSTMSVVVGAAGVPNPTARGGASAAPPVGNSQTVSSQKATPGAETGGKDKARRVATVISPKLAQTADGTGSGFHLHPEGLTSPVLSNDLGSAAGSRRSSGTSKKKDKQKKKKVTMFSLPDELTPKDAPLTGEALRRHTQQDPQRHIDPAIPDIALLE